MYTALCRRIARACMWLGIAGMIALIWCGLLAGVRPLRAQQHAHLGGKSCTAAGALCDDAGHRRRCSRRRPYRAESMLVLAPEHIRIKMEYLIHSLVLLFGALMAWDCAF